MTVTSTTSTTQTSSTSSTGGASGSTMNEQDFLTLLTAQLKYQDPTSPTDTNSFVQEQAQFSTVEGILNLEKSIANMSAVSMIGDQISYTAADGTTASGVVTGVDETNGSPSLQVGSESVAPSAVLSVSPAPTSTTSTSSTSSTSTTSTTTAPTTSTTSTTSSTGA